MGAVSMLPNFMKTCTQGSCASRSAAQLRSVRVECMDYTVSRRNSLRSVPLPFSVRALFVKPSDYKVWRCAMLLFQNLKETNQHKMAFKIFCSCKVYLHLFLVN